MTSILTRTGDRVFGYDFFISYSHADGKNYPCQLKRRLEQAGFKVFLDQTDYVPGDDLRRETRRHVEKSQKLVVVARDAALRSEWVQREVDVIVSRGRTPILININKSVDRAPAGARLASMAREQHWLRLEEAIEDMDGSPTDHAVSELVRSFGALRQEVKRLRILAVTAGVFAILSVCAGYLAWLSEQRRKEADDRLATTLETATRFVNKTVAMSDKFGVPRPFVLELLKEPEQVFLALSRLGNDTPDVRFRRAQTLLDFSDNYEVLGDSGQRLERAKEAQAILTALVRQQPHQLNWQLRLAVAHSKVGTALLFRGDKTGAEREYSESLRIRRSLAEAAPQDRKAQREYSVALNRMGEVLLSGGRYPEARDYIGQARAIRENLANAAPDDKTLKRDLFVCQIWMGDAFKAERRFEEARREYLLARDLAQRIFEQDQNSSLAMRDYTVSLNKIGETHLGDGNPAAAKVFYVQALSIREKLARSDEGNRAFQRDLFVSYTQLGNVAYLEKKIDEARSIFGKALKIANSLQDKDPAYGHWEVDAAEARGWYGMVTEEGGDSMLRDAIARLEQLRTAGRLPVDREGLISEFKSFLENRAIRR